VAWNAPQLHKRQLINKPFSSTATNRLTERTYFVPDARLPSLVSLILSLNDLILPLVSLEVRNEEFIPLE
jgi:hypothetical protein